MNESSSPGKGYDADPATTAPEGGLLEEAYGSILAATAVSSLLIITTKIVAALAAAGDRGVAVTAGLWRGFLPTVSVIGFPSDFAHVVTWSTVGTAVVASAWCLVATIVRRRRADARWTLGAMLAVPMVLLLVLFEWLRFGPGAGVLELQIMLRLVSLLGLSAMAYIVLGLRYATPAAAGVPFARLVFPPPIPKQESRRYN